MKKVGRPLNEEPKQYYTISCNINELTNNHLQELIKYSYQSRTGIIRTAIDYLFYQMNEQEIPSDLIKVIKDLKKRNQDK
jgi:hypothetical protein